MTQERAYLDHNASSVLRPKALEAMVAAVGETGNPSSIHTEGRKARAIVEGVREKFAAAFSVKPGNVFFTSGGTEAANCALGFADDAPALYIGACEHPCVVNGHRHVEGKIRTLPLDGEGVVRLGEVEPASVIAVQAANNETGVLQPVAAIATAAKEAGAFYICDAVQAVGKVPLDALQGPDLIFLSGHKFGGPKGVGAVILKRDGLPPRPLIRGGGQERRWRSGTENVAAIAGLGAAFEAAVGEQAQEAERLLKLKAVLEEGIRAIAPQAVIFGQGTSRLANTTCFAVPGLKAEFLLIAFDLEGVAVSSGSACSSGKVETSAVLRAMGVDAGIAAGAIRVSTGWTTTSADIDKFLTAFRKLLSVRQAARAA